MRVGVLRDLEERLEEVVEDLLEVVDQLVALVDVVQTRNLEKSKPSKYYDSKFFQYWPILGYISELKVPDMNISQKNF